MNLRLFWRASHMPVENTVSGDGGNLQLSVVSCL